MRSLRVIALTLVVLAGLVPAASAQFTVTFDTSLDGIPLQQVLDDEFGPGVIDAATQYEGFLAGDADPPYWEDLGAQSVIIRELAGNADANILGWYREDLTGAPVIDGVDDGVIFDGPMMGGESTVVDFGAVTRFGLYLNPNGSGDSNNAPEPELFFTNRGYNDIGPDGTGAVHAPFDGDVQFLVYNVSSQRGVPAYIVAIEDLDSGSEVCNGIFGTTCTDNDYNDLVIELRAESPVETEPSSFGAVKSLFQN